jgi:hypothetical protein
VAELLVSQDRQADHATSNVETEGKRQGYRRGATHEHLDFADQVTVENTHLKPAGAIVDNKHQAQPTGTSGQWGAGGRLQDLRCLPCTCCDASV